MASNSKSEYQEITDTRFRYVFLLFEIAGLPLNIVKFTILRALFNFTVISCTSLLYITTAIEIIVSKNDLKEFMKIMRDFVFMIMHVWQDLYIRYKMRDIRQLVRMTEMFTYEDLPTTNPETGSVTIAGLIPRLQNFAKKFSIGALTAFIIQGIIRFFTSRALLFHVWFLFDTSVSPTYEILMLSQIVGFIRLMGLTFGPPYLYATFGCIACTQLEKMKILLSEIKQTHTTSVTKEGLQARSEIQQQLNSYIRLHQDIIKYLRLLEDTMNVIICGTLLCLLIGLCAAAFSGFVSWGDYPDMSRALLNYMLLIVFTLSYCSIGTLVSEKFESVRDAAWESDWVGAPVSYQRCILFMIAKSDQVFTLTAGKFVPVSHSTMMNMVNQSLSFFMFLLTMKDKNEEDA